MSDLIPKTADVRDAYSAESVDSTYANRMFDLWLAKYKAKTITNERDRIIKELEANEHIWRERVVLNGLIALVKGLEKKNEELLANPYYPSPYFTVIDEFDSDVFKLTAIEWEKLNIELDKD